MREKALLRMNIMKFFIIIPTIGKKEYQNVGGKIQKLNESDYELINYGQTRITKNKVTKLEK